MGVKQSKEDAFDDYDDFDDDTAGSRRPQNQSKKCFCLPTMFCPIAPMQRSVSDSMGTPILTPPMTKRKRQRLLEQARTNPEYLARYQGLEKETEAFLPPKPPLPTTDEVEIHEGPVS